MRAESQNVIIKKRINSTTILIKYVEVCKWRSLSILKVFVWDTDRKHVDYENGHRKIQKRRVIDLKNWLFSQKHRIKETTSPSNLCFPKSFRSKIFNVSKVTSRCTYRCEISFFSDVFVVEKHYDDQFWIVVSRILFRNLNWKNFE